MKKKVNDSFEIDYSNCPQKMLDSLLVSACMNGDLPTVKKLLASPDLKNHANVHDANDAAFSWLLYKDHLEIIQYLIFEYKIEKTMRINYLISDQKSESSKKIRDMFDIRDFNDKLEKDLSSGNINVNKKHKL